MRSAMNSRESADVLDAMLRDAGIDVDAPSAEDVRAVWEVFKRFAAIPAEDVDLDADAGADGLLVQYGTYDWGDGEMFELDFTRQFSYEEDGEYDGMTQLNCTLRFEPAQELRDLGEDNLWSFDMSREEFFARAEALPGFAGVLRLGVAPSELEVHFGDL